MDNFKFRAWDKKEKKWLFGYDYGNLGGFSLIGEVILMGEFGSVGLDKLCEDVVITQFIGLKDSEGVEYYVGDIAEFPNGDKFELKQEEWLEVFA